MGYLGGALTGEEAKLFIAKHNKIQERTCIKCLKPFESEGAHNRKCPVCKDRERYRKEHFNHRDMLIHKSHESGKRFYREVYNVSENQVAMDLIMAYL